MRKYEMQSTTNQTILVTINHQLKPQQIKQPSKRASIRRFEMKAKTNQIILFTMP